MIDLINKIKEEASKIASKYDLTVYEVEKTQDFGEEVIRVLIDSLNELDIDIDSVANINLELIDIVSDLLPDDVYLEVSSVGIERELNSDILLNKAVGKYIFVSLYEKHPDINAKEIYGDLDHVDEESIKVTTLIKTRKKEIIIERKKIAKIRLAVKF